MSKHTQTIGILALNFADNRLESIRYGGELYVREHSMESERAIESARESTRVSRYHELFGTPERAAETMFTLMLNCARGDGPCELCPAFPRCNWASDDGEENESMILEWLRGESDEA